MDSDICFSSINYIFIVIAVFPLINGTYHYSSVINDWGEILYLCNNCGAW